MDNYTETPNAGELQKNKAYRNSIKEAQKLLGYNVLGHYSGYVIYLVLPYLCWILFLITLIFVIFFQDVPTDSWILKFNVLLTLPLLFLGIAIRSISRKRKSIRSCYNRLQEILDKDSI